MTSLLVARAAIGASRFGVPGLYRVDGSPATVAASQIDGQAGLDLVTGNQAGEDGPSLSFLLNRGTGRFAPEVRKTLSASQNILHTIAVGDFNGDGAGDVAVAVDDVSGFPSQTAVLVFRNTGSGTFTGPDSYMLPGLFPQFLEAGDVTGDGILDLVVCHSTLNGTGVVSVLTGQGTSGVGTGVFTTGHDFTVGSAPTTAAIADVDVDGHPDVIVGDPNDRSVSILYGTGAAGLLGSPTALATVDSPTAIRVHKASTDVLPAILVTSLSGSQLLTFGQTAARNFSAPTPAALDPPPWDMGLADFDGDGILDIAVLGFDGALTLYYGTAAGGLKFGEALAVDDMANSVTVADLNGDGKPDVALASLATDRVTVLLNGADAADTPTPGPPTKTPTPTRTPTRTKPPATVATKTPTRTPKPGTPTRTPTPAMPGDANCDGRIDSTDIGALLTRLYAVGCGGADVDGDGRVTASDLVRLIKDVTAAH